MTRVPGILKSRRSAASIVAGAVLWASTAAVGATKLVVTTVTPTNGATVSASITWQVNVTGGVPRRVDFAIDGTVKWSQTASPYLYGGATNGLDTTILTDGSHTLTATAYPNGKGGPAKSSNSVTVLNHTAVPPTWSLPPVVSGSAEMGQVVSSSTGSWSGTAPIGYGFQWLRCDSGGGGCVAVSGATGSSYTVGSGDVGSTLRSRVTASNQGGSVSAQSAQTGVVVSGSSGSPGSSIYWGAYLDGTDTYNALYGGSWGDAPWDATTWDRFESNAGKKVSIVHWGVGPPWAQDFNYWIPTFELVRSRGDLSLVSMNSGSVPLRDIASGLYDSSLATWAQQAKAYGHPFFLRWDWEMNGSWFLWGTTSTNQNTPADYVAAWRHMHDIFQQAGATNVTWVWCVNAEFTGSVPLEQLYPGEGYVDWTAIDGYNQSSSTWWQSFATIFSATYSHLLQLAPSKPIMVAETSSREVGGSKANWITDALSTQLPTTFPQIKALVWENWWISSGDPWEIESSSSSQTAFKTAISSGYYAPGGSYGNLPLLTKIDPLP